MFESRHIVRVTFLTGLAFFVSALAAVGLTRLSGGLALVWVANAILMVVLTTLKPRQWAPVVLAAAVASFSATFVLRGNAPGAAGLALANVAEAVFTAAILRAWGAHRRLLGGVDGVLRIALAGGIAGPALAAPLGAAAATFAFGGDFARSAFDWWLGHGLGMLLVVPLAALVVRPEERAGWRRPTAREAGHAALLIGGVLMTTAFAFGQERMPLLFLPALPMMVATVRIGRFGAAAGLLGVAVVGGGLTLSGHGPLYLMDGSNAFRLQFFQLYLAILFLMALPTAAILAQQRRTAARLRESQAALRLLADNSTDVLLSLDVDGTIRFASPSVRVLAGYAPESMVGRHAIDMIEPAHHGLVSRAHFDAVAAPDTNFTVEYQARRPDGSMAWYETNMRAVAGEDGRVAGVVSAIRDVTHRKQVEKQLQLAADTDPLTGLANRRPFVAVLDHAIAAAAAGTPAVVALLDLDHFKRVNDQYGHAAGDAALVSLAAVCARVLRAGDVTARLGGEEFAVLLRATGLEEAEAICDRLREAIAAQPVLAPGGGTFRVTASFGLAEILPGLRGETLLAAADRALYAAKDAGRNRLKIAA